MTRRPLLLVFALVCTFLVATPLVRAADEPKPKLAHIKLAGDLDETPTAADPLFGASSENFRDKLERLRKAARDKDVKAIYLQIDGLEIRWGKVDELRRAILDCRAAGKKVYAYLESAEAIDYILALACDEVCLPAPGTLMLTGMRAEVTFYKKLLEHLSIKADVLQVGDYKGAAEPFVRTEMSAEVRKNLESVLDDFYDKSYVQPIADALAQRTKKPWTTDQVKKLIDEGPYTARKAQSLHLIDRVAYPDGVREAIAKDLKVDEVTLVKNYGHAKAEDLDLSNPFTLMLKLMKPSPTTTSKKPKLAVIYAVGTIVSGKGGSGMFGGNMVGSTTLVEAIRQAEEDKTVKAIVLRVDSPGGSALASDLIWNELARCKKPVIASMSDVAASGGYYISMAARKIYAEPGTLTGSIGVFGMKLVLGDLEKKIGLHTETISRGANAGILSSQTLYNESERKAMRAVIDDIYDQFLTKAIEGRKKAGKTLARSDLEKNLAGGRVWTGRQAKENGLVDELGTLADAIAAAKEMAGTKDELEILQLPKARTFMDTFLESRNEERVLPGLGLNRATLLRELKGLEPHLQTIEALLQLRGERVLALEPYRLIVK